MRIALIPENRFGRYLFYAIGEIILVVIGILIALQVNNWNEKRKTKLQASTYKEKLINDIIQDTLSLRNKINSLIIDTLILENYFEYVRNGSATVSELVDSTVKRNNNFSRYLPVNYTFNDMISTGSIKLLKESTRRALVDLSNEQEYLIIVIEKTITDIKLLQHEALKNVDYVMTNKELYENMSHSYDVDSSLKIMIQKNNILSAWNEYFKNYINGGERIVEKSKTALLLLKEYEL